MSLQAPSRTPHRASGRPSGFTLLEMLITVALVVLLVSLAAPSIRELLAVQRLQNVHAALVTDLQFVRSEAPRVRQSMLFAVSGDAQTTCYIAYTPALGGGGCDCLRPPGSACQGAFREYRSVQIPKSSGISLAASSGSTNIATFEHTDGTSSPGDFRIDITSNVRGALRVTVNTAGRVSSCSPDGSIKQVPRC